MKLLLKNCILLDLDKREEKVEDILIEDKKIIKVEKDIDSSTEDCKTIDIKGNYCLPGLIDCHTHLGIIEEGTGKIGVDNNEISDPITPHLRGIDAINPFDIAFKDAIKSGITMVMSGPGSDNPVGGLNAAIKTYGKVIDKMVVRNPSGFKIALGENPMSTYGKYKRCPVTRMGTASLIREMFMRTEDYMYRKEKGGVNERDIKLESAIPVLKGEIPLRAHAHRADDIVTAIRIAGEFNIRKLVIEHGTEAHLVKDYIREKEIPVAFGPMLTPRIKMELKERKYSSPLELTEEGIKVALITDHPYNSIDQLRTVAMIAMSEGMSLFDALKCITIHPAQILQCDNRLGKIESGYDADIAVFDGNPMDMSSKTFMTIIDGRVVYRIDEQEDKQ